MTVPPELPFERSRPFDVGVLLVHGIGEQRKGDTLLAAGSALVEVVQARLERLHGKRRSRRRRRPLAVSPSVSMSSQLHRDEPGEPARAEITLSHLDALRLPDGTTSKRWLLAESWWAESFPQPSELQVLRWMIETLPATVVSHFDRRLRRAYFEIRNPDNLASPVGKYLRFGRDLLSLAVAVVLVPPVLFAMVAILLLGVLPIPFIDALGRVLQRGLAVIIGDSYMLLGNVLARSVIVDSVRRDLRWLAARCERVIVVAHSQGGAIAHEVIKSDPLSPCRRLVTYGSGLQKLALIEQMQARGQSARLWLAVLGLFTASTMAAIPLGLVPIAVPQVVATATGAAAAIVALWSLSAWLRRGERYFSHEAQLEADKQLFNERFRLANHRVEWSDVYASDDPVPNGPLLDEYRPHEFATSVTRNLGSTLLDHTSYWNNRDDFVSRIARIVLTLSGIDVRAIDRDDQDCQDAVSARRRWRVAWRRAGTWAALGAAALTVRQIWNEPPALTAWCYGWIHGAVAGLPAVGAWIAPPGAEPFHSPLGIGILGSLALILHLVVVHIVWEAWNTDEMRAALERRPFSNDSPRFVSYASTLALLAGGGMVYGFGLRVTALLALLVTAGVLILWIASAAGWVATLDNLRRRSAAGSLDDIRQHWRHRFQNALERNARRGHKWSLYEMGVRQLRSPDPADRTRGIAALQQAQALGLADAARALGDFHNEQQAFADARDAYVHGQSLKDGWSSYKLADVYVRLNQPDKAVAALRQAIAQGEPIATHRLGKMLEDAGLWNEARQAYEEGVALSDGLSMMWLGDLWRKRAKNQTAHPWRKATMLTVAARGYRRAIDAGEESAARDLGDLLTDCGDIPAAIAAYEDGVRLGSETAALSLGRLLIAERRTDDAERTLRRAMELSLVRESNRIVFGDAVQAAPLGVFGDAAFELGQLAQERGELPAARRLYRLSLDTSGPHGWGGEAGRRLGRLIADAGDTMAAEEIFADGLALGSSRCGVELGASLYRRGEPDAAANAYAAALACVDRDRALDHRESGAVYEAYGDFLRQQFKHDLGLEAYETAIERGWRSAERRLVDLIIDRRDVERGCAAARKYWRSPEASLSLARYLMTEGRADCAKACLPYQTGSLELDVQAAAILEKLSDYEGATWRYREAMRRGSAHAAVRLARLLRERGESPAALEVEREAQMRGLVDRGAEPTGATIATVLPQAALGDRTCSE